MADGHEPVFIPLDGVEREKSYRGYSDEEAVWMIGCNLHAFDGKTLHGKTWAEATPQAMERLEALGVTPEEAVNRFRRWKANVDEHVAAASHARAKGIVIGESVNADGDLVPVVSRSPTYPELRDGRATVEDVLRHERLKADAEKLAREREAERRAAESVAVEESPTPNQSPDLDAIRLTKPELPENVAHAPDFRSIRWFGVSYSFTANQAPVVKMLFEGWRAGTPDVGAETLLKAVDHAAPPARLSNLFRDCPAWGSVIVQGATKGTYRLKAPESP